MITIMCNNLLSTGCRVQSTEITADDYPHIDPWPPSLWQIPLSEQSFLLLVLMALL